MGLVTFSLSGLVWLAVGVWGLVKHVTADWPYPMMGAPFGAVVGGLFLSGFGLTALAHRIRRGRRSSGRHSREDDQ